MADFLILFSTTDGHTREICARLKQVIEKQGHKVALKSVDEEVEVALKTYDKIILGASIRYGKHSRKIYKFIEKNKRILESKPNAFFSVNLVARKAEKNTPETNPYLKKFLRQIPWNPKVTEVFAGKIDYRKYRFLDRKMIQLIMWITKGPTDPKVMVEFTNWKEVEAFGLLVSKI